MSMIAIIRLKGRFSISPDVENTLTNLKLDKLYACTLVPSTESYRGMLQTCKDVVSYGEVEKETISLLLSKRGKTADGKKLSASKKPEEIAKLASEIAVGSKKLSVFKVLPMFFLAPARGGFGARKMPSPYGPVGKNVHISELIARMA